MVVFCSLFLSNTLNQLARTAHNNPIADIFFEIAGSHNCSIPGGGRRGSPLLGLTGMCGAKGYGI